MNNRIDQAFLAMIEQLHSRRNQPRGRCIEFPVELEKARPLIAAMLEAAAEESERVVA